MKMNFKMPVTNEPVENKGKGIGAFYWHEHPTNIGRFTGKIDDTHIAAFPNRNKKTEEEPDFIITSNKESGYERLGSMTYDEATETFTGEALGKKILVKKYNGKIKGKKAPSHVIVEIVE